MKIALGIFGRAYFILPVNHILGRNLAQLTLGEVRQDFLLNDALFGEPSIFF